jgi:predicted enzyme related to lactoylglutathione lyase
MANPFVHVELHTNDLAKAKAFYTKLFGWKLQDMPMPGGGTYTMLDVGEGTGGGMMTAQPTGSPPRWQAYVGVEDVAASTRNAKELGAKVMMDKTEIPGAGWMSVIVDPTGATIALWQPMPGQGGQKK